MQMNRIQKRRLLVLLAVVLVGVAGIAGVYKYRARQLHYKCVAWKSEGLAANARKDYPTAVDRLRAYRRYFPDDQVALQAFIAARPHVPEPHHQEIFETIAALQHFLALAPDLIDERRLLTRMHLDTRQDTEAKESAERLVKQTNGKDPEALRLLAEANTALKDYDNALKAYDRLLELAPTDLSSQIQRLNTLKNLGRPRREIVALAERLRVNPKNRLADGSEDPRFLLLKAIALQVVELSADPNLPSAPDVKRDDRTAVDLIRAAAKLNPPDAQFSVILVRQLNAFGMYEESMIALRRVADGGGRPDAEMALVRRLWEQRQWPELLTRSEKLIASVKTEVEPELLGLRAIALHASGKSTEARSLAGKLALKSVDPASVAWARIVDKEMNLAPLSPRALQEVLQKVENRDAYLEYYLADTYARMGELEWAVRIWTRSAQQSQTWALPMECLANALLERGRLDAANAAAQACASRARDSKGTLGGSAAMTLIRVEAATLDTDVESNGNNGTAERRLLEQVDSVQHNSPGEPFTLPIQVAMLSRISQIEKSAEGKAALERAKSIMKGILAEDQRPTEDVLLRLAVVNQGSPLGFEDACLDRCERLYGLGPNLAMIRAKSLFAKGLLAEGIRLVKAAAEKRSPGHDLAWEMAVARTLEMARDPEAKAKWRALAEGYPDLLGVQEAVLNAVSTQGERDVIDKSIERLKKLTGTDGLMWRVARARWLIDPASPPRADVEASASLLNEVLKSSPDYADAHFLLARCLEMLGDLDGAINHMGVAVSRSPGSTPAAVQLVRLEQAAGHFEKANDLLEQLARRNIGDAQQRRQLGILFAQAGKTQRAMEFLDPIENATANAPDLLTASLYDQQGRYDQAKAACEALLKTPDPSIIQFAAGLYASHDDKERAAKALGLLDSLKLTGGLKESIIAQHLARFGTPAEAEQAFGAAVKAGSSNPTTWQGLIGWELHLGKGREAVEAAEDGLKLLPEDKGLLSVKQNAAILIKACQAPELRSLAAAIVESPSQRSEVAEAIDGILRLRSGEAVQTFKSIRGLADKSPLLMPLQLYCIDASRQDGHPDDAAMLAERLSNNFPSRPEGPQISAGLRLNAGQWLEAIHLAELWRERSLRSALFADMLMARARLELQQPLEAVNLMKPYRDAALAHPDLNAHADALGLYACGLVRVNDPASAYSILDPLLAKTPQWRARWLGIAIHYLNEEQCKQALEALSAITDPKAEAEQVALAEAWAYLSGRANGQYAAKAKQRLEALLKQPQPSAAVLAAMGFILETHGDDPGAEAFYRRAIQRDPAFYVANNNLAMVLLRKADDSGVRKEAESLAQTAVKSNPNAHSYDTLAHVQARNHDAAALVSMRTTIKLDPINLNRRIDLIGMLLDFNQRQEARVEIVSLESFVGNGLSEDARRKLQALRGRLEGKSPAATAPAASR